jgi:hypothetical protein
MNYKNERRVSCLRGALLTTQNLGPFGLELPEIAEWDQLLSKLGLSDSQALDAIKLEGDEGEQLRRFVLRFFKRFFVPEAVIKAVSRRLKKNRLVLSLARI